MNPKKEETKIRCDDCYQFFKKEEIEEIALTGEKLCKKCFTIRKSFFQQSDDPYLFP